MTEQEKKTIAQEFIRGLSARDDVALHLHNTGRYSGKILDKHLTTVIHLDDGKIRRLDTFISDIPMLNSYFP